MKQVALSSTKDFPSGNFQLPWVVPPEGTGLDTPVRAASPSITAADTGKTSYSLLSSSDSLIVSLVIIPSHPPPAHPPTHPYTSNLLVCSRILSIHKISSHCLSSLPRRLSTNGFKRQNKVGIAFQLNPPAEGLAALAHKRENPEL